MKKEDFYVKINKEDNKAWDSTNVELTDIITRGDKNGQTSEELLDELQEQLLKWVNLKVILILKNLQLKKKVIFYVIIFIF